MELINIDWLIETPIAHRGFHDNSAKIPENSIVAFKRAIENGFPIELDVQVIADQEVVVFHDYTLERMCNRKKDVSSLTRKDLHFYKLLNTEFEIPLLRDILKLVDGKVPLLLEIKRQPEIKKSNLIILNTLLGYDGQLAIQSFDPFILKWFVTNAPLIPRGQLASDFKNDPISAFNKWVLKNLMLNFISKPHFIAYDILAVSNNILQRKRSLGIKILGWTVKNQHEYERAFPIYDNLIFEGFQPIIDIKK